MKKFISQLSAIVLALCALSSCMDSENTILFQDITMGFVRQDLSFQADNGNIYHFGATDIDNYTAGNRLLINCYANSAISGVQDEYKATLLSLVKPLNRDCLAKSSVTDWEKIGNDPLDIVDGWVSGGYLNAKVIIKYWDPNNHEHSLDLIFDDSADNRDCLHFIMKHNANGDGAEDEVELYTTFKIKDYLPTNKREIDVELKWEWEDGDHLTTFTITNY